MTLAISVKNTFVDFETWKTAPVRRRSTSVPRAFKPGSSGSCDDSNYGDAPHSDDSTSASDKDVPLFSPHGAWSESDSQDCTDADVSTECDFEMEEYAKGASVPANAEDAPSDSAMKSKVTLSLVDCVCKEDCGYVAAECKPRTKLKSQARPFESVRQPPAELVAVISSAAQTIASAPDIVDVQVTSGGMGGTTTIVAQSSSSNPDPQCVFTLTKDMMLQTAEHSTNTYILGYGGNPFNNLDQLSFSANICCVPAAHENTACWDFYEKGYCPRCTTCRWDHPSETDIMRVIVMIMKAA